MRASFGFAVCLMSFFALQGSPALADRASPELTAKIDRIATEALKHTGVPSVSIAVVRDGEIVYAHAYGSARLDPATHATPSMRYGIGSISKQFAAAAVLLLAQQGKLSLDDKLSKYFPDLTDADEITLRELLSHTSGYQDYWPQDYVMPAMLHATTPQEIMDGWAKKPLDFAPGSKWQYSNTGYVIIGAVIEKVAGESLFEFLQRNVLAPVGIADAYDIDRAALPDADARGYTRYALGPLHPAQQAGPGWIFGAAELAMTAQDLARWDISVLKESLLQPGSYRAMETEVVLHNGLGAQYGLGVDVGSMSGRRVVSHDGEISGFTAANVVFPDDDAAVVALTNQDAVDASGDIASAVAQALFDSRDAAAGDALKRARAIFSDLQHGRIDRSLFTANCNAYFGDVARRDYAESLGPLGAPDSFKEKARRLRGGMTMRSYEIDFPGRKLDLVTYAMPDGKLEQYIVSPED